MSDRNHSPINGRGDPSGIPARELATWWDRRTAERRSGSTDTLSGEPTVAAVAQLEALVRADDLSAPRPGFLDQLERQIMQTPPATLPTPILVPRPDSVRPMPILRPARRGRGLVDILTVAAVLALLLGGSWSVFNDRANAPTPGGQNGVAGVSTPDDSPASTPEATQVVALDQPWIENLPDADFNGVAPISTDECVTPSRDAGSVEEAVRERQEQGVAASTIDPEFLPGDGISPDAYPMASQSDVDAMYAFFRQFSACRFDTGDPIGTQLVPYTGAYWNLFADEAFGFDRATAINRDVDEVVREQYSFDSSYVYGWSYPGTVVDVRKVPPDGEGRPRLLVTTTGSSAVEGETASLMVQQDGQWRFLIADVEPGDFDAPVSAQVVDILLGQDGYGPRTSANFSSQLEVDFPIAMTLANLGETSQQVSVAGQDLGMVAPGAAIVVQPFTVRPEAVNAADGHLTFEITSVDQAARLVNSTARPLTIAVYAAGSLPYAPDEAGRATPVPATNIDATLTRAVAETASPLIGTPALQSPAAVAVAVAAEPDHVVALDQPWIENLPDADFNGVAPINTDQCVTPSREAGSVETSVRERRELGDAAPTIEPEFRSGSGITPFDYPPASRTDVDAMTAFFRQFSACRFDTGDHDGTRILPYTGAWWTLWADEAFRFDQATQVDRDVNEVVHEEYSFQSSYVYDWSYPAAVLDVRRVPPDGEGHPRLLVTTTGSNTAVARTTSLMVQEDGQWRILVADVASGVYGSPVAAFVVDIVLGDDDGSSPRISGNFNGQIEADFPVAMTIANVGDTPQRASVAGQDLGIVEPGGSIIVQPFRVRPEAVDDADGYFIFEIEAVDLGASPDAPTGYPVPIAVYAAGSSPYGPIEAGRATPAPATGIVATPAPSDPEYGSTPVGIAATEPAVAVAVEAEPDHVVEIDQPWAVSMETDVVDGIAPVDVSQCTVEPRASGSLLSLVEGASTRPVAEFPNYVLTFEMNALFDQYTEGTDADLEAALEFFYEWSACRFEVGSSDLPIQDRYTAAFYALRSEDNLLLAVPEGDGRTSESLVRQMQLDNTLTVNGPYPDEVVDVRIYPVDDRGQPRLLIRHRNIAGTPFDQVSLLVLEGGSWRLADYAWTTSIVGSATPSVEGLDTTHLIQIDVDVDVANPGSAVLEGQAIAGVPIAMTLNNGGESAVSVRIGNQDLGLIAPGQTLRIVPFVVPSPSDLGSDSDPLLTITTTNELGQDFERTWPVSPRH